MGLVFTVIFILQYLSLFLHIFVLVLPVAV